MDKDLKIFALEYVKVHDNLLKEEKLAIGKFVMETSDEQVLYMLDYQVYLHPQAQVWPTQTKNFLEVKSL